MREPPGPRGVELFSSFNDFRKNGLIALERLAHRYGDIVCARIAGRRFYMLVHPDHIRHVLFDKRDNYLRSTGNTRERRFFGNSMQVNNGDEARRLRRIMSPMFQHARMTRDYCGIVVDLTRAAVDRWATHPGSALMDDLLDLALNASVQIHFGTSPGTETDELAALFRDADAVRNSAMMPDWLPTPVNRKYHAAVDRLNRDVYARIKARRASGAVGPDMLSSLVSLPGDGLTDVEIRDSLVSTLGAGADGLGIALNQMMRQIASHPAVDDKLHDEATRVLGDGPASYEKLADLPYSEQVVKESMRLVPPSGAMVRLVAAEDEIDGWKIRPGSRVLMSSWVTQRDPRWFDEPLSFKPDRWTPAFEHTLPTCANLTFGRGPRTCIGAAMAMVTLRLMIVTIAQRYRPRTADPGRKTAAVPFNRADDLGVVLEARN